MAILLMFFVPYFLAQLMRSWKWLVGYGLLVALAGSSYLYKIQLVDEAGMVSALTLWLIYAAFFGIIIKAIVLKMRKKQYASEWRYATTLGGFIVMLPFLYVVFFVYKVLRGLLY